MILSYDTQKHSTVANLNAERYECEFSVCPSPTCGCQTIYIDLSSIETGTTSPSKRVEIDLSDKSLSNRDKNKLSIGDLRFAKLFLNLLTEDDFNLLVKQHFVIKNNLTESATADCIDAYFDYDEIERDGLMSVYNNVLPYANRLNMTLAGNSYRIFDQYCIKSNCNCTYANLSVVKFNEVAQSSEEISCAYVNYKKKEWSKIDEAPLVVELDSIRAAIENQIPQLYEVLKKRHVRLKSIYTFNKNKHVAAKQPLILPKVGRNDPCPCGSGKKFKKCCSL